MRRLSLLLFKAAVSALLLYLSLRSVDLAVVGASLSRFHPGWIALSLLALTLQVGLMAVRWSEIAAVCGAPLALPQATQISFIASFFNQVLPSSVGGDAARIWLLTRSDGKWANATYSVLIDRIVGVLVLALIVIACLPWSLELIQNPLARAVLLLIGAGSVGGAAVFLAIGIWHWPILDRFMPTRHLVAAARNAWRLCRSSQPLATVTACSVAIHLLTVTSAWCCMKAVAAPVGFAPVLFLLPPVLLITTVPISIAGWGVRETSMVAAFSYAGLAQSDGLTLSILFGAVSFALGIIGGAVWIASGLKVQSFAPPAEAIADNP
jgi:glycosyltransferase 2 family protein